MSDAPSLILGHMCDGLLALKAASTSGCQPTIDADGCMRGCDDTNLMPLRFCPMCGERFPLPPRTCAKCGRVLNPYGEPGATECSECWRYDDE